MKNNKLIIIIIICTTFVLISAICAWVYVQKQQIAQKNQQLQQQQETAKKEQEYKLKQIKFQECEANQRANKQISPSYPTMNCELEL